MVEEFEQFEWTVSAAEAGARLDRFLTEQRLLGTRSQVRHLVSGGLARVDGRVVKAGATLRRGQRVDVARPLPRLPALEPEAIELDVLFEDEWLMGINKPPGLVVHPAPGHSRGTLVNALLHRWKGLPPGLDPSRLGIAHRLDKDTSGVMVVAKDVVTLANLGEQFRQREIQKRYLTLVWGCPDPRRGVIDQPIGRHPVDRKRMAAGGRGRAAVTRYHVLEAIDRVSLLRAFPETGRTHQIRVHLAAIGHPVVDDPVYGRGRAKMHPVRLGRQALHAESIRFSHPASGAPITITAPLPEDFSLALRQLRENSLDLAVTFP